MTKNEKQYKLLTEEDMKVIQSDPAGLADYVVRNKIKDTRKTAFIVLILAAAMAFAAGIMCGMTWTKTSIPNNVVKVEIGETAKPEAAAPEVESEGK